MPIRILVADDHRVIREGLRYMLAHDADLEIVGEAVNGSQAVRLARELRPDVILMDIGMPVIDGLEATGIIRHELPNTKVIALTVESEIPKVIQLLRAGASGYLTKDSTGEDVLRQAIKAAFAGQIQLSPEIAAGLVGQVRRPRNAVELTERETDVLRLLAIAQSNKEIAHNLGIDVKTVQTHVGNILHKLGVPSRAHATLYAIRIGLASHPLPKNST